jgi:hypothetical protein
MGNPTTRELAAERSSIGMIAEARCPFPSIAGIHVSRSKNITSPKKVRKMNDIEACRPTKEPDLHSAESPPRVTVRRENLTGFA